MKPALAVALTLVVATPALAGEVAIPEETVSGRIIDVTCDPGACAPGSGPRPFDGQADVVVTQRRTGQQVARVSVTGPRYSLLVPAGRYRIVAIPYPNVPTVCWMGHQRKLQVEAGKAKRKQLKVENVCAR